MSEVAEKPETETKESKERKIYKGEVKKAEDLAAGFSGFVPIQPMQRRFKAGLYDQELPPSFVVTNFTQGYHSDTLLLHYYHAGRKLQREVPRSLELNALLGSRGEELKAEYLKARGTKVHEFATKVNCTLGTDPEIFVVNKKGAVIPAWEFLPTKEKPLRYCDRDGYYPGTAYWDGFQAEFTTPPSIGCLVQMSTAVYYGLKNVYEAARKHNKDAQLSLSSVVQVDPEFLHEEGKKHPEHVAFGCAPSKNIYGLKGNTQEGGQVPYRFAGGHMHFGFPEDSVKTPANIKKMVRLLDRILGVACVSYFANFDVPLRRDFYGQPGEFRTPAHGLEYRTLTNAWLSHPLATHMVFDLGRAAVNMAYSNMDDLWQTTDEETIETIMKHDVTRAREILARNKDVFYSVLALANAAYTYEGAGDIAWRAWYGGMEEVIAKPTDIVGNWRLERTWQGRVDENLYFARAYGTLRAGQKV